MIEVFESNRGSALMVQEVPGESVSSYGIVAGDSVAQGVIRVTDMVEKPAVEDAPSNLAARGRYVFEPEIFEAIERTSAGVGGEIQLTDAIRLLAQERAVFAYVHEGPIYDAGKKLDWLRATLELALRRDDLAKPLEELLREIVERTN